MLRIPLMGEVMGTSWSQSEGRESQQAVSPIMPVAIHSEEGALRAIFEQISDGLLVVDRSGVIIRSNVACRNLLDRFPLEGEHVSDIFKADEELSMLLLDGTKDSARLTLAYEAHNDKIDVVTAAQPGSEVEYWLVKAGRKRETRSQQIYYRATRDHLTGLFNRSVFEEELGRRLVEAGRSDHHGALLWMDLDGFKRVNDTLGHISGDLMLTMVGAFLQSNVRSHELLARVGGDEFAIIIPDGDEFAARQTARRIVREFRRSRFSIGGNTMDIGISVGAVLYPSGGSDVSTLVQNADAAMYKAKAGSRGCVFHNESSEDFPSPIQALPKK